MILMIASALIFIDYSEEADEIIIEADENDSEWENTVENFAVSFV